MRVWLVITNTLGWRIFSLDLYFARCCAIDPVVFPLEKPYPKNTSSNSHNKKRKIEKCCNITITTTHLGGGLHSICISSSSFFPPLRLLSYINELFCTIQKRKSCNLFCIWHCQHLQVPEGLLSQMERCHSVNTETELLHISLLHIIGVLMLFLPNFGINAPVKGLFKDCVCLNWNPLICIILLSKYKQFFDTSCWVDGWNSSIVEAAQDSGHRAYIKI